jgi:hypothetical protein
MGGKSPGIEQTDKHAGLTGNPSAVQAVATQKTTPVENTSGTESEESR